MIICLCEGVTDREIRETIREGARSVRAVRQACGAGKQCGSCVCDIRSMLDDDAEATGRRSRLRLVAAK